MSVFSEGSGNGSRDDLVEESGVDLLRKDAVADKRRVRLFGLVGKVDVRLPGKGNPNSHAARPVRQIISMLE